MVDRLLRRKNLKYKRKIIGAGLNHTSIDGWIPQAICYNASLRQSKI